MRLISRKCVLYTEMLVDDVLIHVSDMKRSNLLATHATERPVVAQVPPTIWCNLRARAPLARALQIGGSNVEKMAKAAAMCEEHKSVLRICRLSREMCMCPVRCACTPCSTSALQLRCSQH